MSYGRYLNWTGAGRAASEERPAAPDEMLFIIQHQVRVVAEADVARAAPARESWTRTRCTRR